MSLPPIATHVTHRAVCRDCCRRWAFGISLAITALLTFGTKESSRFNIVVTLLHVLLVVFIIIAGLVKSNPANSQPFFPFEVRAPYA
jgi:APA family basic amino acid/polyamine antiporter